LAARSTLAMELWRLRDRRAGESHPALQISAVAVRRRREEPLGVATAPDEVVAPFGGVAATGLF
jgi:hypothetical protein